MTGAQGTVGKIEASLNLPIFLGSDNLIDSISLPTVGSSTMVDLISPIQCVVWGTCGSGSNRSICNQIWT